MARAYPWAQRYAEGQHYLRGLTVIVPPLAEYGVDRFEFKVIEADIIGRRKAYGRETYWIEQFRSLPAGCYNATKRSKKHRHKNAPTNVDPISITNSEIFVPHKALRLTSLADEKRIRRNSHFRTEFHLSQTQAIFADSMKRAA
jgi:hypothetical protein